MIRLDPTTHTYWIDDIKVISVTQLLKHFGYYDYDGVPQYILDRARIKGTYGHKMIYLYLTNNLNEETLDEKLRPYLEAFKRFQIECKLSIENLEYQVGYLPWGLAGTPDCRGSLTTENFSGRIKLDWKFTFELNEAAHLQLAMYDLLENKMTPDLKVDSNFILHLQENKYDLIEVREDSYDIALSLIKAYNWKRRYLWK